MIILPNRLAEIFFTMPTVLVGRKKNLPNRHISRISCPELFRGNKHPSYPYPLCMAEKGEPVYAGGRSTAIRPLF